MGTATSGTSQPEILYIDRTMTAISPSISTLADQLRTVLEDEDADEENRKIVEDQPVPIDGEVRRHHGRDGDETHPFACAHQHWQHQTDQQIPLKLNRQRPVDNVDPRHMREVVQVSEVEQDVAAGNRHPRNVEERHQDEVGRQDRDRDGCQVRRIQADVALQQKARIIAQHVARAIEAPGDDESGDDKEDVDAEIAVLAGWAQEPSLPGNEMTPGHRERGKGAKSIDNADSLLGTMVLHFTTMLNGCAGFPSNKCHRSA